MRHLEQGKYNGISLTCRSVAVVQITFTPKNNGFASFVVRNTSVFNAYCAVNVPIKCMDLCDSVLAKSHLILELYCW